MRLSRDEQLALVGEQEHSGGPALAFCRERGICYQSFLRWRKRAAFGGGARHVGREAFVELAVQPAAAPEQSPPLVAELGLGGGIVLKIFAPSAPRP
jgi:hypothetical protein